MSATRLRDAITALKDQRDTLKAESTPDPRRIRRVNRLLRQLQIQDGSRDASDEDDVVREAFVALRDTEADPNLFVEEEWREDATLLMQKLHTLPEDENDERAIANGRLVRKDQVQRILRRTADNADTAFDVVRDQCFSFLERFFNDFRDNRGNVDTQLAATLNLLSGPALTAQELETELSKIEKNAARLKG